MYAHCGTVYNSKDLEPTQMPIDHRLDKDNVAHIHHEILCSHKKKYIPCVIVNDFFIWFHKCITDQLQSGINRCHLSKFQAFGGFTLSKEK